MTDFITLTCPTCNGQLQITDEINRFACSHCGNEHVVKRGGGIIALQPVIESIKNVQLGVDKTASEHAIKRLTSEISELELKVEQIKDVLLKSAVHPKYHPSCTQVLDDYFERKYLNENPNAGKGLLRSIFYLPKEASQEIGNLEEDDLLQMYKYFLQEPQEEFYKDNFLAKKLAVLTHKPFIHVRQLLSPIAEILPNLKRKRIELQKHREIVSS